MSDEGSSAPANLQDGAGRMRDGAILAAHILHRLVLARPAPTNGRGPYRPYRFTSRVLSPGLRSISRE
jgi:hypothetical protein